MPFQVDFKFHKILAYQFRSGRHRIIKSAYNKHLSIGKSNIISVSMQLFIKINQQLFFLHFDIYLITIILDVSVRVPNQSNYLLCASHTCHLREVNSTTATKKWTRQLRKRHSAKRCLQKGVKI